MRLKILYLLSFILLSCTPEKKEPLSLLDCVPQNTIATLQINDWNMLGSTLNTLPFFEGLFQLHPTLFSDITAVVPKAFPPNALLNIVPEGKEALAVSFIYTKAALDSLPKKNTNQFTYNTVTVNVEELDSKKIYSAQIQDVQMISSSKLVIENSIRNLQNSKKGIQNPLFYKLAEVSDNNAPLTLFLHRDIEGLLKTLFPNTSLFPFLGSSWFSFDFNTKKDPFTLDGVSFINDSIPDRLSLLKGLEPQPLVSPEYIPQNFDGALVLALNDYKTLEENFKKYTRYKNIPINNINFDVLSNVDELAWVRNKSNIALYIHLNNTEALSPELLPESSTQEQFRGVTIQEPQLPEDVLLFLETFGMTFNPNALARIDDYLIYATDKAFLKQLIGVRLDGNVLSKDFNFKSLQEDLADSSTFLWIGNTVNLKNQWKEQQGKNDKVWKQIDLESYPLLALQGIAEKNFIQSRFTAQRDNPQQQKNTVASQYTFSLDAPLARAPQWIKNHRNKTMDVVVQDLNNVLYLFSNKGVLFWKKQLSGPIIGKIEQVDLYKNRRLQMAFRTADRFMILDRNGKVVPPFDKKIASDSPQHFSVFDYDLKRNYRFLLTHGKKVELLDNRGRSVSGFKLKSTRQPLQNPPKHIRFGNKDYLIFQDINGQVRILNRQGTDRITLKEAANTSSNPVFEYRNTFATTTKEGSLLQIDSKGNLTKTPLGLQPGHQIDMTSKSLVTLSENKLNIKGIPVQLPYGNYTAPKIYYIDNTIFVTLTDLDAQKVYAFYSNGTAVGGFPVYGTSPASITNADDDKAIELVVQSEANGLLIYQIN